MPSSSGPLSRQGGDPVCDVLFAVQWLGLLAIIAAIGIVAWRRGRKSDADTDRDLW